MVSGRDSNGPSDRKKCSLCENDASIEGVQVPDTLRIIRHVECQTCGSYSYERVADSDAFSKFTTEDKIRLAILLCERRLNGLRTPLLLHTRDSKAGSPDRNGVLPRNLLRAWPKSVPDRINRSFVNLVNHESECNGSRSLLGRIVDASSGRHFNCVLFGQDYGEQAFMIDVFRERGWVNTDRSDLSGIRLRITSAGWERYEDLTQGSANVTNPAFVAMWFGGKDQSDKMSDLFAKAIEPACAACGWRAKRADMDEHNETIVDRMIADIQKAPFVVAELTNNNLGVYYEAGFAKGLGKTVIFCCPEEGEKPHFDVSGINQVRWKNETDLKTKLRDRIRATLGDGPHPVTNSRSDGDGKTK